MAILHLQRQFRNLNGSLTICAKISVLKTIGEAGGPDTIA